MDNVCGRIVVCCVVVVVLVMLLIDEDVDVYCYCYYYKCWLMFVFMCVFVFGVFVGMVLKGVFVVFVVGLMVELFCVCDIYFGNGCFWGR